MKEQTIKNIQKIMQIDPTYRAGKYLKEFCSRTSEILQFQYVLIATPNKLNSTMVDTVVAISGGEVVENFSYDLAGTPCENVTSGNRVCTHLSGVAKEFPEDLLLDQMNVDGYSGAPLHDRSGELIGLFVILDKKPLPEGIGAVTEILASRVGFELEREIELFSYYNYQTNLEKFLLISNTDLNGKITKVNDKFCEVSGYKREELIGKDHRIINSAEHPKSFFKDLWETITSGNFWEGEVCNKAKDGSKFWVNSFMFPLYKKDQIVGYSSVRFEVTNRKNMEVELENERFQRAFTSQLAALGEMSAGIGHEIANPLSIISSSAILLNKKIDQNDERSKKCIERIVASTERINKIIKGLHHLSQGARSNEHKQESINAIIDNTLGFCEEALRSKHIELKFEKLEHDSFFYCNSVKISQILLNLINNAKDSIDGANCKDRWIEVILDNTAETLKFIIKDSGPGIPIEQRAKVMQSFFTTKDVEKGTGLGLPLVKRFVEEHNGHFKISDDPKVTIFIIEFPKSSSQAA